MSIFACVKSDGATFILSPTEMTEVVDETKDLDPYIMKREDLKHAFLNHDKTGRIYYVFTPYRIGTQEGHVAPFYVVGDGIDCLKIGCQFFGEDATTTLRKWALEGMTKDEYEERHMRNQKIEGFGMETTMHMPCPFCGAPDFTVYKIFEVKDALAKGGVCKECSRGAKTVFHSSDGIVKFEMVQTEGDDAPSYVLPMRRAE